MAYIPPHKRHSTDEDESAPIADSLIPWFKGNLNLGTRPTSHRTKGKYSLQRRKIVYAKHSICRWWPVGSTDDDPIPATFSLEPFSHVDNDLQTGEKPLVLVGRKLSQEEIEALGKIGKEPWISITEKILPDLLATLQNVRDEMQSSTEAFKPSLVARFGKIFFHGGSSFSIDDIRKASSSEGDSRNTMHKIFHTKVPKSYMEDIQSLIVATLGIEFDSEKEHYHIKVFDKTQPDSTISCKCTIGEDGKKLEVYKVELNQVRHFLADISCLYKDLDLRVLLCNKRVFVDLDEEEKDGISKLLDAATLDRDVKGGIRWPLGKESVGDRFRVVSFWHTKYTAFNGPNMRLKLRTADRFDFATSSGEVSNEVDLKMSEINQHLCTGKVEPDPTKEMLQRMVKIIWEHFLDCKYALT